MAACGRLRAREDSVKSFGAAWTARGACKVGVKRFDLPRWCHAVVRAHEDHLTRLCAAFMPRQEARASARAGTSGTASAIQSQWHLCDGGALHERPEGPDAWLTL